MRTQSVYDFAGGSSAFLALATAHHQRCLEDPVLNHPFSHPDGHPEHVQRLASYWAEVFGGPPAFSQDCGGHTGMLRLHAGQGIYPEAGERFVSCFQQAIDDAGLPGDTEFRHALVTYMRWAVSEVQSYSPEGSTVAGSLVMPHWSWNGLQ